ncbi:Archaeal TRASH domain protein [Posidoniimonas corsicana]|uniref:Archaeal TRASH domain protein n=1 Tax=Posidoniimonas corsicana TaxID=1938618 RepID=A0A5C5VBJ0_9BACT|nr:hypothetical protein [Posidoniimonas corsicana]TWT35343.1 Archaeal TRASH domain protein [Posidoniimonas corsicana]
MKMQAKLGALFTAALLMGGPSYAQHDPTMHQHTESGSAVPAAAGAHGAGGATPAGKGPHGGSLESADGMQLESVVDPGGVRVYAYNAQGQLLDLRNAKGVATLTLDGAAKRYRYDLFPEVGQDQAANALSVRVDLRQIAGREGTLRFQLVGLTDNRRPTKFTTGFVGPVTEQQKVANAIAAQKVCPVSNQPLGSMGDPIPVTVGDDTIYVCCAGCVGKVKAEFSKYLAQLNGPTGLAPRGSDEVRPGVFKTVAADQPFIAAQQKCPVMDEPLGGMGAPLKVHANGKAIYICCAGCAKKIQAEPAKYLQVLADQGVTAPTLRSADAGVVAASGEEVRPGVFKATASESPFVAAQKLCPVMDEPLDGMGGPYRVNVDGRAVYICCPGCAKKLQAEPEKYLAKLHEQGITPPAAK